MNKSIVLGMVEPYLKNKELTFKDFEQIFNMLSLQEQYSALEILYHNKIELVDKYSNTDQTNIDTNGSQEEEFEILYDESLFVDDEQYDILEDENYQSGHIVGRKNVHLSNRVLCQMVQNGDQQAKQDLCVKNQGLVDKYVNMYQHMLGSKMDFEDLRQAGMMGMVKAAERFDFAFETEFSTYAVWWIKQSIMREIMNNGQTIRIPVHKMEQILKVIRADTKYAHIADYYERIQYVAWETKLPVAVAEDCLRLYNQFIKSTSLDLPIGEEEETLLGDVIPIEGEIPVEELAALDFLKEELKGVLSTLTEREQKVLRLRFGLDDGRTRTLEEVGKEFNVTRERIRQIEAKALRKLRHPSRSRKLKDFLD